MELGQFDFSKKVFYHPRNVALLQSGGRPFPVTVEIDLTNACNHRCSFCFYAEHLAADRSSLSTELIKERLTEMKALGTRGVSFTGGGEPMLHKDFVSIIEHARAIGLDIGLITNGSAITPRNVESLVRSLTWVRVSMAGGDAPSYSKVQGVDHFQRVISNLALLSDTRKRLGLALNIGVRMLCTPDNIATVRGLATVAANARVDYLQLAPDQFTTDEGAFWNAPETRAEFDACKDILSASSTALLTSGYVWYQHLIDVAQSCHAHFFMIAIQAEGDVGYCKNARGAEKFSIGNINQMTLKEIWDGQKTKEIESWCRPNNCGLYCKHIQMNVALENVLRPGADASANFVG